MEPWTVLLQNRPFAVYCTEKICQNNEYIYKAASLNETVTVTSSTLGSFIDFALSCSHKPLSRSNPDPKLRTNCIPIFCQGPPGRINVGTRDTGLNRLLLRWLSGYQVRNGVK